MICCLLDSTFALSLRSTDLAATGVVGSIVAQFDEWGSQIEISPSDRNLAVGAKGRGSNRLSMVVGGQELLLVAVIVAVEMGLDDGDALLVLFGEPPLPLA